MKFQTRKEITNKAKALDVMSMDEMFTELEGARTRLLSRLADSGISFSNVENDAQRMENLTKALGCPIVIQLLDGELSAPSACGRPTILA